MSRIIYKIRDKKRINKCGKHFVWVEEQHTLGFLYSKITVEDRFYINLFSVFRPFGRLDISYQLKFINKEDTYEWKLKYKNQ